MNQKASAPNYIIHFLELLIFIVILDGELSSNMWKIARKMLKLGGVGG